jgi:alkylhydroperoxidase family enzyme
MLGFIEKLTLSPGELGVDDIEPLRAAGISDQAIEDAIHVAVLFNIMDRIADSLGFQIPSSTGYTRMADVLLSRGYK